MGLTCPSDLRAGLDAIIDELKCLKSEGAGFVCIADETLGLLRKIAPEPPSCVVSDQSGRDTLLEKAKEPALTGTAGTNKPARSKAGASDALTEKPSLTTDFTVSTNQQPPMTAEVSAPAAPVIPIAPPPQFTLPEGDKAFQWEWLRQRVLQCPECNKHVKPGKKVVFGTGNINADIFFCGEAPGAEEEIQGEPFVGPAGQLLTRIIQGTGLQRSDVYIGNIMNWRPEMPSEFGNRPPTHEEMAFCLPYLKAQLAIIQPKVIVALGNTAVNGLLGPDSRRRMGSIRGNWFTFESVPLMVTFHPSYLLRNNTSKTKRMVWEDIMKVMEKTGMTITEKQRGYFL